MDAQKERNTSVALAISGWSLIFVAFVAGFVAIDLRPVWFLIPLGLFTGVLGLLRMWITPKPGRKFFSPAIWWGGFYGLVGLLLAAAIASTDQGAYPEIVVATVVAALLLFSVPGFTVMAMGIVRTSKVNKSLKGA